MLAKSGYARDTGGEGGRRTHLACPGPPCLMSCRKVGAYARPQYLPYLPSQSSLWSPKSCDRLDDIDLLRSECTMMPFFTMFLSC